MHWLYIHIHTYGNFCMSQMFGRQKIWTAGVWYCSLCYNNGAKGVQATDLEKNLQAVFVLCSLHNWNLVLLCATSGQAGFFLFFNNNYIMFILFIFFWSSIMLGSGFTAIVPKNMVLGILGVRHFGIDVAKSDSLHLLHLVNVLKGFSHGRLNYLCS